VAQATLASERGLTLVELTQRMQFSMAKLCAHIRAQGLAGDSGIQAELAGLSAKVAAACALADRYLLKRISGDEVPGDASIVKLYYSRTLRDFVSLGMRISGLEGQYREPFTRGGSQETGNWAVDFMNSYNWSIAGGSDEIQRNIIAERLLGMPREPRSWQLAGSRT
jgi:alkylation response protein AidB-like acyl-CoA dehydrogenase